MQICREIEVAAAGWMRAHNAGDMTLRARWDAVLMTRVRRWNALPANVGANV